MTTILLCEPNPTLRSVMLDCMRAADLDVYPVQNAEEALERLGKQIMDVCLIEAEMSPVSGIELVREMRRQGMVCPVMMTSESVSRDVQISAYAAGVDWFVQKPFVMDILLCQIRALLRLVRLGTENNETVFDLGGVRFDSIQQLLGSKHLTTHENELLLMLCRQMNKVIDKSVILKSIWRQDDCFTARSLSVYIHRLRTFLAQEKVPCKIVSSHNKGYRIIEE